MHALAVTPIDVVVGEGGGPRLTLGRQRVHRWTHVKTEQRESQFTYSVTAYTGASERSLVVNDSGTPCECWCVRVNVRARADESRN